jgi:hypothetical protein
MATFNGRSGNLFILKLHRRKIWPLPAVLLVLYFMARALLHARVQTHAPIPPPPLARSWNRPNRSREDGALVCALCSKHYVHCAGLFNISELRVCILIHNPDFAQKSSPCRDAYRQDSPSLCLVKFLKGTVSRGFFASGFFSWISFPPAPEYPITTISNFF